MEEAVISWTIQQLESRRAELLDKPEPVKKEVEGVLNELRMILEFLREKKPGDGRRLHYLILDVLEMAMDINQLNHTIDYFNWEITYVRSWLVEARRKMLEFGADVGSGEVGEGDEEEDLVGLEEDVERLLGDAIFHEEEGLRVTFIIGMVGVGKTALARQIYNHASVVDQFEFRAWVCASSDMTQNEVLRKLIQMVVDSEEFQRDSLLEKMESVDNRGLHRMLCQYLQGKRYLIVIDDPSKQLRLESILKGLPNEDRRSRFLVSGHHHPTRPIHYLHQTKPLDANKSWQLFLKTISSSKEFSSEHEFPKRLDKKGREMLRKCDGLPLAIKEVGRQLVKKRQSGSEWEELLESIDLGSTLVLMDSFYHKLDPQMKLCFLHLALFKENTTIKIVKFLQIWAAGGMVPKSELGAYFYKMIKESIIEIKDMTADHRMKSFRVNIVLHSLSVKKAEEEIDFKVLRSDGGKPSQSPHHRVISCHREKFDYSTNQDKHLVSLFFHGGGLFDSTSSYWKSLEHLRILDFEDFGLKVLPETIGMLIELIYLGLRNNYIKDLPQSLGCLKKLEVLDIAQNFMIELPDIIWELCSLRHLYMSDVILRKPLKIDVLQDLVTLTYISADNWTYELSGLHMMTSLRKLGIEELDGNSDMSKLFASLAQLESLQTLILKGFRFKSMPCLDELGILNRLTHLNLDGLIPRLPSADNFPPNISCLKLLNTRLDEDPMPVLGNLPKLFHLKLQNAYTGQQMTILQGGFHMLQEMCIKELWNLRNVRVGEDAMPKMAYLVISNCPHLEILPEEIGSLIVLDLKMVTTRKIARKIQNSALISKIRVVEINPYA